VQRRIQFVDVLGKADEASLIRVLKKVDKTFVVRNDQPYTAINDDGFEVDILRRIPKGDDPHPFRMSEDVQDFWAVPATTAETMTSAAPFSQVVVATTGKMAIMHTVHPLTFVSIKERLAGLKERDQLITTCLTWRKILEMVAQSLSVRHRRVARWAELACAIFINAHREKFPQLSADVLKEPEQRSISSRKALMAG
jgi:hypothetical protein